MVQPYLSSVDAAGETAIVLVDGELSHELRKGAVLRPGEVAPVRDDALGAAEVMYDPDLVRRDRRRRRRAGARRRGLRTISRRASAARRSTCAST